LNVAFSRIGHYGKADLAVPFRLMRVMGELASAVGHAPYAVASREQARRLAAACQATFPMAERTELEARLAEVERAVTMFTTTDPPS
jgi:uncharacterized membrane protein